MRFFCACNPTLLGVQNGRVNKMTDNNTTDKYGNSHHHSSHYSYGLKSGHSQNDSSQGKDDMHHHKHHHSKYKYLPLCGWMRARRLLFWAMVASLLSTLIFVFCRVRVGIGINLNFPVQWLYVVAHLFGCFGNTILLWAVLSISLRYEKKVTFATYFNSFSFYAVYATALYHIACTASYAFVEVKSLYVIAMVMWCVRTFFCIPVVFILFKGGDSLYRVTAIILFIYYIAGTPNVLPTYLGMVQWIVAKIAAIGMAIMLYYCGWSKYSSH